MKAIGTPAVALALCLAAPFAPLARAQAQGEGEIKGLGEFLKPGVLIVNGQRVRMAPKIRIKGAASAEAVPLGSEVKAAGAWRSDGSLLASRIEVKPNTLDQGEEELLAACNEIEHLYAEAGQARRAGPDGSVIRLGAVTDRGPLHTRARAILDRLLPPYIAPDDVRLYVVENREWNAFAMANFAIYVHSGLLADLDDDEVAIVLGHELAHATLEHTRRSMKRGRWARIARGAASIGGDVMGGWGGLAVDSLGGLGASALGNGFSRGFEDEADRVGLRYAYEGGFRVEKGPALWLRFAEKYHDQGGVGNFLFGSHADSRARAREMEAEVAKNYAAGIDDAPSRAPTAEIRR